MYLPTWFPQFLKQKIRKKLFSSGRKVNELGS